MSADPAVTMANEGEARALRIAVSYALDQGLATDFPDDGPATNASMVSLARKLGLSVPAIYERSGDVEPVERRG